MPARNVLFKNGSIFHVFNKSTDQRKVFLKEREMKTFLNTLAYYRSDKARVSFSQLKHIDKNIADEILTDVTFPTYFKVHILAYCLMPTHFHMLVKQVKENGIQKFLADSMNSFTRYYNILHRRIGPLFLPRFKAVSVSSDEQLIHVSRYIHLNPYVGRLIANKNELDKYRFSSYRTYINSHQDHQYLNIQNDKVIELFHGNANRYRNFVLSNAEHQMTLEYAKHALKWRD